MTYTPQELMVAAAAREIGDGEVVFVGMRLPLLAFSLAAQSGAIDLSRLHVSNGLQVVNRGVSHLEDGGRRGLLLSADSGEGIAYLTGVEFSSGTIE